MRRLLIVITLLAAGCTTARDAATTAAACRELCAPKGVKSCAFEVVQGLRVECAP